MESTGKHCLLPHRVRALTRRQNESIQILERDKSTADGLSRWGTDNAAKRQQHLNSPFGGAYELEVTVVPGHAPPQCFATCVDDLAAAERTVEEGFPVEFYFLARAKRSILDLL
jgi:hypothetical protein